MIFRDDNLLPVDETGDGGDSDFRCGILALSGSELDKELIGKYEKRPGVLVRHPSDYPADNENNYTRDQLIVYMTGLWKIGDTKISRRVFWAHAKRLFFCQNIERDIPGSTKYPWPHSFINDRGEDEKRVFDFRDPLFPDDIMHLILCSRLKMLYPFAIVAYPFLVLSIIVHSKISHSLREDNQTICKCIVAGSFFCWLLKKIKTNLKDSLYHYWSVRNETEYADIMFKMLG